MYIRAGTIHHLVRVIKEAEEEGAECEEQAQGQKKNKNPRLSVAWEISCWLRVDKIQPVLFKTVFEVIGPQLFEKQHRYPAAWHHAAQAKCSK